MVAPVLQPGESMVLLFDDRPLFAGSAISIKSCMTRETGHTSQWLRMAERPPAINLRGGGASDDSLIILMANFVVAYVVDFQFDLFSSVASGLTAGLDGAERSVCPVPVTDGMGLETRFSALWGRMLRWVAPRAVVHVPLDSSFREVKGAGAGKTEDRILRSGSE